MIRGWFDSLLEFFSLARFSVVDFLEWQLKTKAAEIDQLKIDNAYLFCVNKKLRHDLDLWRPIEELKNVEISFVKPKDEGANYRLPEIKSPTKKKGKKNASKSKSKKKG